MLPLLVVCPDLDLFVQVLPIPDSPTEYSVALSSAARQVGILIRYLGQGPVRITAKVTFIGTLYLDLREFVQPD